MAVFTALAIAMGVSAAVSAAQQLKAGKSAKQAAQTTAQAQREAGKAARSSSESEAVLADFNAQVAEVQAQDAIERGAEEEGKFRSQIRGTIGAQRAGIAAGNIDVGYGSAADVQADAAYLGELDAQTIRTNAQRQAWGAKVQAEDYRQRARIARKEGVYREMSGAAAARASIEAGNAASTQAKLGAINTGLSTGTSLLSMRYGMRS